MCRWVTAAALTRPGSPHGVLNDAVHPEAGGGLRRLVRRPHDRSVVADVRHGEPVRPRELADGRHQRIGGRTIAPSSLTYATASRCVHASSLTVVTSALAADQLTPTYTKSSPMV